MAQLNLVIWLNSGAMPSIVGHPSPWSGMARDLAVTAQLGPLGWAALFLFAALPLISVVAAARGVRLAFVPLALTVAMVVFWFSSYAFHLPNPGLAGAGIAGVAVLGTWAVLIGAIALERSRRRRG